MKSKEVLDIVLIHVVGDSFLRVTFNGIKLFGFYLLARKTKNAISLACVPLPILEFLHTSYHHTY